MPKKCFLSAAMLGLVLLTCGCGQMSPTFSTLPATEEETVATAATLPTVTETEPPTTEAPTTAPEPETISIELTTAAPEQTKPVSTSGHMEAYNLTYEKNNVSINYPMLIGMTDEAKQEWANEELEKDVMSLLTYYGVNEETDTFKLDYQVSTIYRGEFSLVYEGEFTKAGSANTIKVRAAEDLDLATGKHIRLSDRLALAKVKKCILGDEKTEPDYEIVNAFVSEDTIKTYLANQDDIFFENLVKNADFGAQHELTGVYSYNYLNNIAVVIPLPHVMGDYVVISIKQQTK